MTAFPKPSPKKKRARRPLPWRSAKGQDYEDELAQVTPLVMARAGHYCEVQLAGCTGRAMATPHHRKRRTQGGDNSLANLLAVCFTDHRFIHDNPDWAYERGLMIRRNDPVTPYERPR